MLSVIIQNKLLIQHELAMNCFEVFNHYLHYQFTLDLCSSFLFESAYGKLFSNMCASKQVADAYLKTFINQGTIYMHLQHVAAMPAWLSSPSFALFFSDSQGTGCN